MEVEAKFSILDEQTFQQLLEMNILARFSLGDGSVAELHDRYLDTAARDLLAGGYACRLRRSGDRILATLKGLGQAVGAVHQRPEHEVELAAPLPPWDWPPSPARDLALGLGGGRPIAPLFEIEQIRHTRPVHDGDRLVAELSLDRGQIRRVDGDEILAAFLELETELLPDGNEGDLAQLTAALLEVWKLVPQNRSKFERGLVLLDEATSGHPGTRAASVVRLTSQERAVVERLTGEREVFARRARLLLAWDDGLTRAEVSARSGLSPRRIRYWLSAFRRRRLEIFPAAVRQVTVESFAPPSPASTAITSIEAPPPFIKKVELLKRPGIEPDDPMSEAGRKTFRFHYRQMLYHEPGTRLGEDIEALHDMRVATRRMRAAFRVFEGFFDPKVMAPYLKGLRQTGRVLGAVRDLDVFRERTQAYLDTLPPSEQSSLSDFLAVLEAQREAARERMITYLDGPKHARFEARFGEFVETPGMGSLAVIPKGDEPRAYRVRHVAPVVVYERLAAVQAYDEWVSIADPPLARLHALRIACKRLRYTLEFFQEVLGPDTKALIKEVVSVQDHLGAVQDAVVASGILRDFLVWGTWGHAAGNPPPDWATPVIAPGVASYMATRQTDLRRLLDTFPQTWQRITTDDFGQMIARAVAVL